MNYAFYVSGKATRLSKILESQNNELMQSISLVFSDDRENLFIKNKLKKYHIPYLLFDYSDIKAEKNKKNIIMSDVMLDAFIHYKIDYCFSFGSHLLKGKILQQYRNKIINFHPSLLPFFAGENSIDHAIEAKVYLIGNTAHFIDDRVDKGPIILQSAIPINAFHESGYDAVLDIQIEMLLIINELLKSERIQVVDNKVKILGADYHSHSIFPKV